MKRSLFLLSELVRRDLTSRYAGSFGGPAWTLVQPAILCALYSVVFARILRLSAPPDFAGTFTEFLLGGLLPWLGFHEAVTRGSSAITDQAHLVKKLPFPAEFLVLSSLVAAMAIQAAALCVFVLFLAATGRFPPALYLLLPAFAFELLLLAGPVLALAALHVFFRDLSQVLGPALMVVFYLTPIVYPESMMPDRMRAWLLANPVRSLVGLFRAALFGAPPPPPASLVVWGAASAVLAFAGLGFFRRSRRTFSDLL